MNKSLALLPALLAVLLAAAPLRAQFDGSLVLGSQITDREKPVTSAALEFNLLAGSSSVNGRFSGAYQEAEGGDAMRLGLAEALLEFRSPLADVSAGDISPQFSDYTLSSPSNEHGAELNLKAAGFSFRPVYLLLAKADEAGGVYERRLYGASVAKEDLPLGFSLAAGGYRAEDEAASLRAPGKTPERRKTLGVKAGFKAGEILNLFYEFARSGADADSAAAGGEESDDAVKGGLGLSWDRWNISARYSRCGRDYRAAGTDSVDNDQSKVSADVAYAFSDYANARLSETRITDGVSRGENERVNKQSSLFSLGFSFPGLPSVGLDYSASRNKNRLLVVNDEMEDFGYSLNYALPAPLAGLALTANGRLSKSADYTLKSDPARTVAHNLGLTIPAAFLAIAPNYSYTANENTRTRGRTYYETAAVSVSAAAFSGRLALSVSGSKSRNYDNFNTVENETRALNSQLALNLSPAVKIAVSGAFTATEDALNPAGSASSRQYAASTTIAF